MRPGPEFPTMSHGAPPMAAPGANATAPHSPWQSPVPYLFGGLAAMLGLIAFALLILACSYWKLSGYLDADRDGRAGSSGEGEGEKGSAAGAARPAAGFQEHVVVIMAGEERPTFLATPAESRAVVELGAVPAAPGSGSGEGEEKKEHADDGEDCEQEGRRLGAEADAGAGAGAGEERPTFLATPAASRAVVELGAVPATPGSGSGEGEEKEHADDGEDCEQEGRRLGAEADAVSRSSESSTSTSTSNSSATALAE